jgi:hypothetical protein
MLHNTLDLELNHKIRVMNMLNILKRSDYERL